MSGTVLDEVTAIRESAAPLRSPQDLDPLVRRIGHARIVLLGEATHGTAEFYRWRAELTRRLLAERDFSFVAVEGDWPECHRVHCCAVGAPGAPNDPGQVLWGFRRWPTWLWANEEVAEFAAWLRSFNATGDGPPCGFHGLDVYSLGESLRGVLGYVRAHAPGHVEAALRAFRCFEPFGEDPRGYGVSAELVPENCREEVVRLLTELRSAAPADSVPGLGPAFVAEQNAEVVAGAERYYREMVRGGARSWNTRDTHMSDTLDRLLRAYGPHSKAVVWAHNSHVGDARATDMAAAGMLNLGQLVRERHAADGVVTVGFGTFRGSVLAADHWGGAVRRMPVEPARPGSLEGLLHDAVPGEESLHVFAEDTAWAEELREHRAIGVVHRGGGYVPTVPSARYDAFVHCDETTASTPLHQWEPEAGEEAQTYPSGV
ncbi:erythromycin esterase-like protein [Amycolatopsis lexingtonensis]|uniref:Erythromycin esterase-like protein n=1 Tax=Amycolatopsis lexingtonensis TaxID=218822 RepID=A0ABR9HS33_9PSEU|nr:erythromycin esterase family protein [Amycolatopsis lexingtonensis]MBE1493738.1 erythromycin esterase-like protein [Amycolatopsis lexingtonensis]